MLKQFNFQAKLYFKTVFALKIAYSWCFSLGGNIDFPDFLQKSFMTSTTGLAVTGVGLCSRGRGFESQHWLLDGHLVTLFCC